MPGLRPRTEAAGLESSTRLLEPSYQSIQATEQSSFIISHHHQYPYRERHGRYSPGFQFLSITSQCVVANSRRTQSYI